MTQIVIEGRLEYLGWRRPWNIERGDKVFDLSRDFWTVAGRLKDAAASMPCKPDEFVLKADVASNWNVEFDEVGSGIILARRGHAFGFTNVLSYCEAILCNLNGREVIASIEDNSFSVFANPHGPQVPALKRKKEGGNIIPLPDDVPADRCGLGKGPDATCIFLVAGAGGFECAKFAGSMTRTILDRRADGTFRATRIGDCRIDGWED
jgi:hypothetical protein